MPTRKRRDLAYRILRLLHRGRGLLVTLGMLVTVELLSYTPMRIPSPIAAYLVAISYAAYSGGLALGLLSWLISFLYALRFLAEPGWPPHYTDENTRRLVVLAIAAPTIAVMVGVLKRRAEMFVRARAEARALERFRDLVEGLDAIVWEAEAASRAFTFVSRRAEEILGYSIARWLEDSDFWIQLIHPDDRERVTALTRAAAAKGEDHESEYRAVRADGKIVWVRDIVRVVRDEAGVASRLRGVMVDVTLAKRMEEALRDSEARYRPLFEGNPQPMYVYDIATHAFLAVNEAAVRAYGYTREEFLSMNLVDIRPAEDRAAFLKASREAPPGSYAPGIWRHRKKDGTLFDAEITYHALTFQGRPARLALAVDVTERRRGEERLKKINQCLLSFGADANENIGRLTALLGDLLGAARAGYARRQPGGLAFVGGWRTPRDPDLVDSPEERVCRDALARPGGDLVVARSQAGTSAAPAAASGAADGGARTYVARAVRGGDGVAGALCLVFERNFVPGGGDEEIVGIVASALGVEEQRNHAEESRAALSEQLRQSQKMEAVGRLAGGVAHDFNNLLTAISGHSELALSRMPPDDPQRREIEQVKKAGDRAAALTRQLLAFSRRQVLEPRVLDLNGVVAGMEGMLRRLIGEPIELVMVLSKEPGRVKTDPAQMEQVVMNLAVNARDAMPNGGRLTIETALADLDGAYALRHVGVRPGPYVLLAVSDTGVGLDADALAHLFEPFFTTKEQGKGTGLGLSMVYGIVKQSLGNIWAYSEAGRGTTIKVYLPRVAEPPDPAATAPPGSTTPGGTETILLVEDEEVVRSLAREVLEIHGYTVLEAANGLDALEIFEARAGAIHLILTDVVMPQMGGPDLEERATRLRPEIKVVFMSGYTANAIAGQGVLRAGAFYLQKPFTIEQLARKVREALDAPAIGAR